VVAQRWRDAAEAWICMPTWWVGAQRSCPDQVALSPASASQAGEGLLPPLFRAVSSRQIDARSCRCSAWA